MSLFPPPGANQEISITSSPRKQQAQRARALRMPSVNASRQATSLLLSFIRTNGPRAVLAAISSHGNAPRTRRSGVGFADVADTDEAVNKDMEDSPIGRDARVVGRVKDCWELLRPNLVNRRDGNVPANDSDEEGVDGSITQKTIGQWSWDMLEILVTAFEEDERRQKPNNNIFWSPLLISQVPHTQAGQPWNIEKPLNIVFAALSPIHMREPLSFSPEHAQLGLRLLSLLVNVTISSPIRFSPSALLSFSGSHICRSEFPPSSLTMLLAYLSTHHENFMRALCCTLLEGGTVIQGSHRDGSSAEAPRTRARPQPRSSVSAATTRKKSSSISETASATQRDPSTKPPTGTILRYLASSSVPPSLAVTPKVESESPEISELDNIAQKSALAKMYLLISLAKYHLQDDDTKTGEEWSESVRNGSVRSALATGFSHRIGVADSGNFNKLLIPLCLATLEDIERAIAVSA